MTLHEALDAVLAAAKSDGLPGRPLIELRPEDVHRTVDGGRVFVEVAAVVDALKDGLRSSAIAEPSCGAGVKFQGGDHV